jgi:hypothetical protein
MLKKRRYRDSESLRNGDEFIISNESLSEFDASQCRAVKIDASNS